MTGSPGPARCSRQYRGTAIPTDRLKEQLLERAGNAKSQTTLDAARRELAGEVTGFDHVSKVRNWPTRANQPYQRD